MCELIHRLVDIESPTGDAAGVGTALGLIEEQLLQMGLRARQVTGKGGTHLLAMPSQRERDAPAQLLLGHVDTVWPKGTIATMPFRVENGRLFGPGVFDMKGGLVQMVFALRALDELRIAPPATPVVFVNSDEEKGSHDSSRHIRRLARAVARAFVMEPAYGTQGALKTTRKGVGSFTISVHGKAAHAGLSPDEGASAILEMSHLVQGLFELNTPEQGITVNVGTIDGGLGANVVAPRVVARVDARTWTDADAETLERSIRSLTPKDSRCAIDVEGGFGRPPMEVTEPNQALWRRAATVADELGIEIEQAGVGGGSDANTTSRHAATLDGLGAVGQGAHAADEQLIVSHLPERAALLAGLIASPLQSP
jgi:glutamate carboxypeptidase